MKQFCPKCGEWYDVYSNVCPKCDVLMYDEDDYCDCIEYGKKLKKVSLNLVNGLNNWGWLMLIAGIIGTFLSAIFSAKANTIWGAWIIPIVWFIILVIGIVFIRKSSKFCRGKKLTEPPENKYVKCPYCNSKKVIKLTTLDRTSSVIVGGLGSGKIGKQWHCHNCDSDF